MWQCPGAASTRARIAIRWLVVALVMSSCHVRGWIPNHVGLVANVPSISSSLPRILQQYEIEPESSSRIHRLNIIQSTRIISRGPSSNTPTSTTLFLAKKKKKDKDKSQAGKTMAVNRIAYRNYEVLETLEAGISLRGTEVKAIRDGKLNLRDGYVRPSGKSFKSCNLHNVHIGKHSTAGAYFQHEERRVRPLLLHKAQARKWAQQVDRAPGMTIVPLKAYFNKDNKLKLEIALCRGKNVRDKRDAIKERDAKREASRIIKSFRVGS